jgi:glycosyltransferase involved in cell wall biosynthesis
MDASEMSARPLILHVSSDYTDGLGRKGAHRNRHPTRAINNLVEAAENFDHLVFSLRRRSSPFGLFLTDLDTPVRKNVRVFAYGHFGLPLGVGLLCSFWVVARVIHRILREQRLRPDAIHAHRLTFDGIAGWLLARWLNIPLFISVRGEVERKVFRFKPSYRPLMRRIVSRAAGIFYVSAWYVRALEKCTGVEATRAHLLPNLVTETSVRTKPGHAPNAFVTVLNLNIWRKKGLDRLLAAFAQALAHSPSLRLNVIGSGEGRQIADVRGLIKRLGIERAVHLEGELPNEVVRERMSDAIAFVLPSHNETFGMVYVEALFVGAPILYSRGTGIDGFLDGLNVGVAVDPKRTSEICRGLLMLSEHNADYRETIFASGAELVRRFGRENVLCQYERVIRSALTHA